jgi:hypothetical protein
MRGPCRHRTDEERALSGTWVADELRLAVTKGYRITKVHEVYEYNVTHYDRETGEGGLFVQYIDTFLKLKAEASGYPSWVRTPANEDRYIEEFRQSEGILLDRDSIRYNAAKRGLAKLCLNSMWGKFCEIPRRPQTQLISDPQELYRFLATTGIEVTTLLFAGDSVCWISWQHADETDVPILRHTNDVIGSFVTAGARLHLYSYLDKLKEHALYCDTDSVIFSQPRDDAALVKTGDCLGDMTSELKPCEYISEFVCGGPKNYAYHTINTETGAESTVCKVRGFTLNYGASQVLNFEKLKHMILKGTEQDTVTIHTERKIKRKRGRDGEGRVQIVTESEDKTYRVSFLKRRRLHDNTSVPFGYIKPASHPVGSSLHVGAAEV